MVKRKNEFLGIEWTGNFLKIVCGIVGASADQLKLLGIYAITDLANDETLKAVRRAVTAGGNIEKTMLLISRSNVIVRYFELPSVDKKEIGTMIGLQLDRHLPYSSQEMYYDYA